VFGYADYYPAGGWNDFQGSFDTLEEVRAEVDKQLCEYYDIVDRDTEKEIQL
jgi:hypothetical protein